MMEVKTMAAISAMAIIAFGVLYVLLDRAVVNHCQQKARHEARRNRIALNDLLIDKGISPTIAYAIVTAIPLNIYEGNISLRFTSEINGFLRKTPGDLIVPDFDVDEANGRFDEESKTLYIYVPGDQAIA